MLYLKGEHLTVPKTLHTTNEERGSKAYYYSSTAQQRMIHHNIFLEVPLFYHNLKDTMHSTRTPTMATFYWCTFASNMLLLF